jgi:hypothetical protein
MPISATSTTLPFPSAGILQEMNRYMPVPTATDMRRRSLFGIPLKSQFTGQEIEDVTLQDYITQSISEVEHELDLYITPVKFSERHDYSQEMNSFSFGYLKLNHAPILSVEKYALAFNNGNASGLPPFVSIPLEFVHVQPQEGTIQLIPTPGVAMSSFVANAYYGINWVQFTSIWPGAVTVEYTAGFPTDKIPALLAGLIENLAALKFLSSLGPVLFPYSSVSIGIDGVSQSTGTPGPAFLQGRLSELEKVIQTQKEAARGYYQKRFLIDYL